MFKERLTSLTARSRVLLETSYLAASQEILRTLWKQTVHHRAHSPPPVPVLSQTKPVQNHPHFFPIHYPIPPKLASSKSPLSLKLSYRNPIRNPPTTYSCQMSRPCFHYPNNIWTAIWIIKPQNEADFFYRHKLTGRRFSNTTQFALKLKKNLFSVGW